MSSRFHNKYHRHNHHTTGTFDPRYPDSGHDPIASHDSPFLGPFVMVGTLSAVGIQPTSPNPLVPVGPAGSFYNYPVALQAIAVSGTDVGIALEATGDITTTGDITVAGNVSAANVFFTGIVVSTYSTPVQSTGEFLTVNVNGSTKLIRLWNTF